VAADERVWIGTNGGGIAVYDGLFWTAYTVATTSGGLASDQITAIAADGDEIWAGTPAGVSRLDTGTGAWTTFTTANSGLPHNAVRAIAFATVGAFPNTTRAQFFGHPGRPGAALALRDRRRRLGGDDDSELGAGA
jgi:ligand-binding sensor domain-containing protein